MIFQNQAWDQNTFEVMEEKWNKIQEEADIWSLTPKDLRTLQGLFYKSIDFRNSKIDYQKSSEYAVILQKNSEDNSISFQNLALILDRFSSMKNNIDSLEQNITALKSDLAFAKKKRVELEKDLFLSQKENRILKDNMAAQSEIIEKLKKLELFLLENRKQF